MHFVRRGIAAATIAVLIGLPMMRVVCAQQCARAHEHAPESAANEITAGQNACVVIGLRDIVMRERTSGPFAQTPDSTLSSVFTGIPHIPQRRAVSPALYRGSMAGLSPGTIVPLRV
jgi:hypothetical protein